MIPRPETECLVEQALKRLKSQPDSLHILELGTGSGVLSIVLAKELPQGHIWAGDISEQALSYALENAKTHGVSSDYF